MFVMFCVATAGQVLLELYVNSAFPFLKRLQMKYKVVNLGWSIGLSMLIGMMFPAAGLIIFSAALASTVVLWPYYAALRAKARFDLSRQLKKEGSK